MVTDVNHKKAILISSLNGFRRESVYKPEIHLHRINIQKLSLFRRENNVAGTAREREMKNVTYPAHVLLKNKMHQPADPPDVRRNS